MCGGGDNAQGFPRSALLLYFLPGLVGLMNQHRTLVASEGYHVVISTNRMARRLEENTEWRGNHNTSRDVWRGSINETSVASV
jgi:hypothetical protein